MRRLLRLWFSFADPVDRKTYAVHGMGLMAPLPGGRTRLEGRTVYVVDMFPQPYWTLPAGRIVAAIHGRVLRHIAALAEEEED